MAASRSHQHPTYCDSSIQTLGLQTRAGFESATARREVRAKPCRPTVSIYCRRRKAREKIDYSRRQARREFRLRPHRIRKAILRHLRRMAAVTLNSLTATTPRLRPPIFCACRAFFRPTSSRTGRFAPGPHRQAQAARLERWLRSRLLQLALGRSRKHRKRRSQQRSLLRRTTRSCATSSPRMSCGLRHWKN